MEQSVSYFRVNSLAPADGTLSFFCKKVGAKKSDGFAVIEGGEVFVIDMGGTRDEEMLNFLLSLREKWLAGRPELIEDENARLEIHIIVSHAHPDHMGAMPRILSDRRLCAVSFYAPERSYRSKDVPEALPDLVRFENNLAAATEYLSEYGHTVREIFRLTYGKAFTLPIRNSETVLDIYPAPYDWSEDRPSDSEGFHFLQQYQSPTYQDNPGMGYTNGILNGNSLWVKITKGEQVILITGDQRPSDEMLGAMIRYYGEVTFQCDILKLPHHGDGNYPPYLLKIANPNICIFTASEGRATPETQALCQQRGDEIYYLCDGNLILTLDGDTITSEGIRSR